MVTHHQHKFVAKLGQRATLQASPGTAQQLKRVFSGALVGVPGPFDRAQTDRPARLGFRLDVHGKILG